MINKIKNESNNSSFVKKIGDFSKKVARWIQVEQPIEDIPITTSLSEDLLQRGSFDSALSYRDITEDGFMVIEDGKNIRLGFVVEYSPMLLAGEDIEESLSSIIGSFSDPGTVVQFGILGHSWINPSIDNWQGCRSSTGDALFKNMSSYRGDLFRSAAYTIPLGGSDAGSVRPKNHINYIAVTLPFEGDIKSQGEWEAFFDKVKKYRSSLCGSLDAIGMHSYAYESKEMRMFLRLILNPHLYPEDSVNPRSKPYADEGVSDLIDKRFRLITTPDGFLDFSDSPGRNFAKRMACMTIDHFPKNNTIGLTNRLLGNIFSATEKINVPFLMYTNILILNTDDTKDKMIAKKVSISRQIMTDSPTMRALAGHLFEQRDEVDDIIRMADGGKRMVGVYAGINVWDDPLKISETTGSVRSLWAGHGFSVSPETFITLPIYMASLPMHFFPHYDGRDNSGLQRMITMTTSHASFLLPVQGAWKGTPAKEGGVLLASRQGQVATFNIQGKVVDNYNFAVVASSGAGKSFFSQDLVMDFLSKDGLAFIIDAGRSYYDLCELLGGTNLIFKMDSPLDLNPFRYVMSRDELKEGMELLKSVTLYMMFANKLSEGMVSDWEDKLVEHAIEDVWMDNQQRATYKDVQEWLINHSNTKDDPRGRARDMADQLRPYTEGRFKEWFDGTGKKADLNNRIVVIEMDDLKSQGSFRDVVLTMMMNRIAETMYKTQNPEQPKLMLIDEAWDLLASNQAGDFINRAYRTYRKYGGSAGVITQSFKDFSMSKAAEAAYTNSSWVFALKQKKDGYNQAIKEGVISPDEVEKKLVETVHTRKGVYSEVFVKCDSGQGVYRFYVDAFSYWLFTTAPDDKGKRKEMIAKIQSENPNMTYSDVLGAALANLADGTYAQRGWKGMSPSNVLKEYETGNWLKI